MPDIYEQHTAAFAQTSAFVVMKEDRKVATIALKFPRDGAGRLYAYVHYLGLPMVRGFAAGGGYDKRSAACANAARKISDINTMPESFHAEIIAFREALMDDNGFNIDTRLLRAGFNMFQAV
jgi:hypothetical protein